MQCPGEVVKDDFGMRDLGPKADRSVIRHCVQSACPKILVKVRVRLHNKEASQAERAERAERAEIAAYFTTLGLQGLLHREHQQSCPMEVRHCLTILRCDQ